MQIYFIIASNTSIKYKLMNFFRVYAELLIRSGIKGFSAIETIDPMKLNRIKIFQGEGPVSINSSLSKATVTGFANVEVIESK